MQNNHRMNISKLQVINEIQPFLINQHDPNSHIFSTDRQILKQNKPISCLQPTYKPLLYELQSKANGIILIKQDYIKLFYIDRELKTSINSIQLCFYDKSQSDQEILEINISKSSITIYYLKENGNYNYNRYDYQIKQALLPEVKLAPLFLQKKIWIQLNRIQRKLCIYTGDIAHKKPLIQRNFSNFISSNRQGWNNEADVFDLPNYNISEINIPKPKKINEHFTKIKYFTMVFKISSQQQKQNRMKDFISIQVLKFGRIYKPVIDENLSLLKPNESIHEQMPPQLKYLYDTLKNLNIKVLPDFNSKILTTDEKVQYLNWQSLQSALYNSLTTPYGYTIDGKPIGILNHLYKMKFKKQYRPLILSKKQGEKNQRLLSKQQLKNQIYKNRSGYIRLQLLPHEGLGPGSMAVLQVWPPYHSSSLHNHGQAYGIIKVLSGSIRVQNFSELSFQQIQKLPYLQSDYDADQYTWLSELSFGIHRLINVKPQTCITLQSYYHSEVTNQFFSVVKNVNGVMKYIEYYPQNDWVNYLNWKPDTHDNSIQSKQDLKFIQTVKREYNLIRDVQVIKKQNPINKQSQFKKKKTNFNLDKNALKLNQEMVIQKNKTVYCFPTMVLALKRQYQYLTNYL